MEILPISYTPWGDFSLGERYPYDMSTPVNPILEGINETLAQVRTMAVADQFPPAKLAKVEDAIRTILNSTDVIQKLRSDIEQIVKDDALTVEDLPAILTLTIDAKALFKDTLQLSTDIDRDSMKYFIFAIIYQIVRYELDKSAVAQSLLKTYAPLWKLLNINPQDLKILADSCWKKCFST